MSNLTIEKALEILRDFSNRDYLRRYPDFIDALQMGYDALAVILKLNKAVIDCQLKAFQIREGLKEIDPLFFDKNYA